METGNVTIGVVNFNGMRTLPLVLKAIHQLDYPRFDVVVVDNCSSDGSREWVQENYPKVRCVCLESNIGLPAARNVILQEAASEFVFIMDNDIVLEPDVLDKLMRVMEKEPGVAACHPEIRDENDPYAYHYNGGWIHYLCTHISRPKPDETEQRPVFEIFDVVSGAAMLIKTDAASRIGGFDGDYFFNWEDGDFTARLTLAGYLCVNVPSAIVHHRGKFRGTSKFFYQVRNRWFFILKLYSWRTLFFAAPALFLFECSQALFCLVLGTGKDYVKGNLAVLYQLPQIFKKRRAFQKLKVKRDRDWLRSGEMYIPEGVLKGRPILIALKDIYFRFIGVYWKVIRSFC